MNMFQEDYVYSFYIAQRVTGDTCCKNETLQGFKLVFMLYDCRVPCHINNHDVERAGF